MTRSILRRPIMVPTPQDMTPGQHQRYVAIQDLTAAEIRQVGGEYQLVLNNYEVRAIRDLASIYDPSEGLPDDAPEQIQPLLPLIVEVYTRQTRSLNNGFGL